MFALLLCIRVRRRYIITKLHRRWVKIVCVKQRARVPENRVPEAYSNQACIKSTGFSLPDTLDDYMYLVQKFQLWLYPF